MISSYIRKEIRIKEKRMNQIERQMKHFQQDNQAHYLRDLIDIGYLVKQKEIENTQQIANDLETDAHISSLISHELLLIKMGIGSEHISEVTQDNIHLCREKLKVLYGLGV